MSEKDKSQSKEMAELLAENPEAATSSRTSAEVMV